MVQGMWDKFHNLRDIWDSAALVTPFDRACGRPAGVHERYTTCSNAAPDMGNTFG